MVPAVRHGEDGPRFRAPDDHGPADGSLAAHAARRSVSDPRARPVLMSRS